FLALGDALEATGRDAEAFAVRARGAARLREVASRIGDEEWRRRFLEDVPAHRRLVDFELAATRS
ncbi:MAG: hypothetical protein IT379_02965, partial [Deltaproteobacteria bacterium]|nr:hypothetical protein [Deltaproteobacteria bacterium]